jgi:hypothetical protein
MATNVMTTRYLWPRGPGRGTLQQALLFAVESTIRNVTFGVSLSRAYEEP